MSNQIEDIRRAFEDYEQPYHQMKWSAEQQIYLTTNNNLWLQNLQNQRFRDFKAGYLTLNNAMQSKLRDSIQVYDLMVNGQIAVPKEFVFQKEKFNLFLIEVLGCFRAAEVEGFYEKLNELPSEQGGIRDIIERRIMHILLSANLQGK